MGYKGCVVEIRKKTMIVMTEDCFFKEIRRTPKAKEGMEVTFSSRDEVKNNTLELKYAAIAAAGILLLLTSFYGIRQIESFYQPVAVFAVDINPSIHLEVNKNNRVIKAVALDKEAETIDVGSLRKKHIADAVNEFVLLVKNKGYIQESSENYILVTGIPLKKEKILEKSVQETTQKIKKNIEQKKIEKGIIMEVITLESNTEILEKANKERVSAGKMAVFEGIKPEARHVTKARDIRLKDIQKFRQNKIKDREEREERYEKELQESNQNKETRNEELNEERREELNETRREKLNEVRREKLNETRDEENEETSDEKQEDRERPVFNANPGNKNREQNRLQPNLSPRERDFDARHRNKNREQKIYENDLIKKEKEIQDFKKEHKYRQQENRQDINKDNLEKNDSEGEED